MDQNNLYLHLHCYLHDFSESYDVTTPQQLIEELAAFHSHLILCYFLLSLFDSADLEDQIGMDELMHAEIDDACTQVKLGDLCELLDENDVCSIPLDALLNHGASLFDRRFPELANAASVIREESRLPASFVIGDRDRFLFELGAAAVNDILDQIEILQSLHWSESRQSVTDDQIRNTLVECYGNKTRAAKRLGITRQQLYRRIKQIGESEL